MDKPGADVMRIRLAITDVVPSKPSMNYATTILPGGFGVKAITKVTTGIAFFSRQYSYGGGIS